MTCAGCAATVEAQLKKTAGVQEAVVNLANHTTTIEMLNSTEPIQLQKALQTVGYDLIIDEENASEEQQALPEKPIRSTKGPDPGGDFVNPSPFSFWVCFLCNGCRVVGFRWYCLFLYCFGLADTFMSTPGNRPDTEV